MKKGCLKDYYPAHRRRNEILGMMLRSLTMNEQDGIGGLSREFIRLCKENAAPGSRIESAFQSCYKDVAAIAYDEMPRNERMTTLNNALGKYNEIQDILYRLVLDRIKDDYGDRPRRGCS